MSDFFKSTITFCFSTKSFWYLKLEARVSFPDFELNLGPFLRFELGFFDTCVELLMKDKFVEVRFLLNFENILSLLVHELELRDAYLFTKPKY